MDWWHIHAGIKVNLFWLEGPLDDSGQTELYQNNKHTQTWTVCLTLNMDHFV